MHLTVTKPQQLSSSQLHMICECDRPKKILYFSHQGSGCSMIQCPQITTATFRSAADIFSNNGSTTTTQHSVVHIRVQKQKTLQLRIVVCCNQQFSQSRNRPQQ